MSVSPISKKNITLVSYLNQMPDMLIKLIDKIIDMIQIYIKENNLPDKCFTRYLNNQLHATILGMEVLKIDNELVNANFLNNNGILHSVQPVRFLTLLNTICSTRNPLFMIRFGGFVQSHCSCSGFDLFDWKCSTGDSEFHAFNRTAYEGSFYSFNNGPVMITGWPVSPRSENEFPRDLFHLRRAAENYGFLEKYHTNERPYDKDDDFYIRIGTFNDFPEVHLQKLQSNIRNYMSNCDSFIVDVFLNHIDFIYYQCPTPLTIIDKIPLNDALTNPKLLTHLYKRWFNEN
jgi:hypothetical protein